MTDKNKEISWWKRALLYCFHSTKSAILIAHTSIVVAFVVSLVLQLFGVNRETAGSVASIVFIAWMCLLLVAVEVWSCLKEQLS